VRVRVDNPRVSRVKYEDELRVAPFWAVINIFRSRIPRLAEVVKELGASAKATSFWATGVATAVGPR